MVRKAKRLRRTMSLPEVHLWQHLRTKPGGLKFRRQHPIGAYVLDFYCPAARIGIEVDGIAHDMGNRPARDATRADWLAKQGIRLIRLPASDVLRDVEETVEMLCVAIADRKPG